MLGLIQTIGVCLIMTLMTHTLSKITTKLVIFPIENMIQRVEHISADPICALQDEEERLMIEELDFAEDKSGISSQL